jgi:hypothetical protein
MCKKKESRLILDPDLNAVKPIDILTCKQILQ